MSAGALPLAFALEAAYPNPFGPGAGTASQAVIRFALPEAVPVRVVVYDALGREVARPVDGTVEAGVHEAVFDGSALPGGAYLYRLTAGPFAETGRMTLVK